MPYTKQQHKQVAAQMERDSAGHFLKKAEENVKDTFSHLEKNVQYNKNQDDLLNVHVGNPLKRITDLLEEIKKQKAFAFTLKGSLGLAGVAIALSVFGFFGGSKILCDKGTQTQIGTVRVLNTMEPESSNIPLIGFFVDFLRNTLGTQTTHNRIVLELEDTSTIQLPLTKASPQTFKDQLVYTTGPYDSCSRVLKAQSIEVYK